jgi:hypothetical protein
MEKDADVLIADRPLKLHAPKGSVSWEYIVRSVDQGALANIEEYRIHPAAASTRQTRLPFSQLDKQILLTWVRRASKDTNGNEIYKLLEEQVRPRQDRRPVFVDIFQVPAPHLAFVARQMDQEYGSTFRGPVAGNSTGTAALQSTTGQ